MAEKNNLSSFFEQVRDELKKIEWPTKEHTVQTTLVVAVVVFIITLYLGLVDSGFSALAAKILG